MHSPRGLVGHRETQFLDIPQENIAQNIVVDNNLGHKATVSLRLTCKELYFNRPLLKTQTDHIETLVTGEKVFRLPTGAELSADFVLRGYERYNSLNRCTHIGIHQTVIFFVITSSFFCMVSIFPYFGIGSFLRKEDLAIALPVFLASLLALAETSPAQPIRKILEWVSNRDEWETPINDATPLINQMKRLTLPPRPTQEEIRKYLLDHDDQSDTIITFSELLPNSETT